MAGESFDPATRERYRRCIVAYLHHLKERRERASVASAKAYVESGKTQGVTDQLARDALRWFFLAARFQVSDTSANRLLADMTAKGLIRQMGERKGTYYVLP